MAPGSRLLVFEQLLEPADAHPGAGGHGSPRAHVTDLLMLLMLPGCDRTEAEYRGLLAAAGLDAVAVRPPPLRAPGAESVLEAVPAPARPR